MIDDPILLSKIKVFKVCVKACNSIAASMFFDEIKKYVEVKDDNRKKNT